MENKETNPAKRKHVLPGDQLAALEEFESGSGSVVSGDNIVSSKVGDVEADMTNRVMKVVPAKHNISRLPEVGDYVTGKIESASSSVAQVKIDSVNEEPSSKELSGMLSMRDERHRRNGMPIKPGDVVRARISSTKNSIYHLSLDDAKSGVLYTVCSVCGGRVIALGRDRVKCTECGAVDERLLSEEFVALSRS
ncbi:MAG: exosome complex RNA-binding protein Csl4 [Nitrososphaerales archaeon]